MGDSRTITIKIDADGKAAIVGMEKVAVSASAMSDRVAGSSGTAGKGMQSLDTSIAGVSTSMLKLAAAWTAGSFSIGILISQLHAAGMAAEKLRNGFEVATGGITSGANAMAFVRGEAERLGLDLQSTSQAYLKLAASSKGTALEGQKTELVFSAIAGAGRSLGLSVDEVDGALLAISQMMNKGVVSAEELRGQLGERLPGAFQVAARAMGVSTSELGKMLEQGQVISDEFLPKFAAELQKTFPPGEKAIAGLTAETGRLKTAWFELKETVMDSGGDSIFTGAIRGMTGLVNLSKNFVADLKEGFDLLSRGEFKKGFGGTPRIFGGGKSQPLNTFDPSVLGLGSPIGVDTSGTDWLFKNNRVTPFLTSQQIDATSAVVKDRSLMPFGPTASRPAATAKADPWHAAEADDARERYRYEEKAWQKAEAADRVERRAYEQEAEAWRAAELADLREKMRYADELVKKVYDASAFGGMMNGLDDYALHATNVGNNIRESVTWAFQAMEDSLVNFAKTGKLSFSDLADSIVSDLVRIAVQSSITSPFASAVKSINWGSIFGGGSSAPATFEFHDGGLVQRFHDGGLIPRYHFGGLAADEIPAILQTGERVLDREHNALLERFANKASAPTNIKIELIDQTSRGVAVEQGGLQFDGEAWAVRAVVKDFKSGGITRSLFSGGGNY